MIGEGSLLNVRNGWSDVAAGKAPSEATHVVPGSRQRCDLRRYRRTQDPARIMVKPLRVEVSLSNVWVR